MHHMKCSKDLGSVRQRGSALVEFAFVAFQFVIMLLASIEFCRMIIVYNSVANAAKAGSRYAITHGSTRTGTGPDGPSSPGSVTQIVNRVETFAGAGLLSLSGLNTDVEYLLPPTLGDAPCTASACNGPGYRVRVNVSYLYDPWISILPLNVTLRSISTGVITY